MAEMEDRLNSILGNPQMMQQIMAMAQSMGSPASPPQQQEPPQNAFPEIDLGLLQKLTGMAKQTAIDSREQGLLKALGAYLSGERISRLEKAMRAAKMASFAATALGGIGPKLSTGR